VKVAVRGGDSAHKRIDERIGGDNAIRVEGQLTEDVASAAGRDRHGPPIDVDLDRAED